MSIKLWLKLKDNFQTHNFTQNFNYGHKSNGKNAFACESETDRGI